MPSEVKQLLAEGWVLLDVRPPSEASKVGLSLFPRQNPQHAG
jgi:hypothetical protein